jgi:cell division protein FtsN
VVAKRNQRKQAKKKSLPIGAMLISFAVGLFVMFLVHLKDSASVEKTVTPPAKKVVKKDSNVIEPTFDFYTLLPEMEVVVDKPTQVKKRTIVSSPPQKTASVKSVDKVSYLIQVGSFKNAKDADGFKARLAFLGIESRVQTVTIDNAATWHRVQVGPIVGRDKVDQLQKQLKKNNIDSLLMRARHG